MPSQKILEKKKVLVEELSEQIKNSCSGVLVNYTGINVENDINLRKELRENKIKYSVVKNSILLRAFQTVGFLNLEGVLNGATAVALSEDDYVVAAKILCKFSQDNKFFTIKAGFVDDSIIDENAVFDLAKLPSKEVLIAMVLGGLNAPITSLVYVLTGVLKSFIFVVLAIEKSKSQQQ
ncbi:MAG: 50S ribosomal protein L10 [Oscillospiraceae bacterium]|nr:50S ribosomal protein L10 [Oscillospiraceae bacterium]